MKRAECNQIHKASLKINHAKSKKKYYANLITEGSWHFFIFRHFFIISFFFNLIFCLSEAHGTCAQVNLDFSNDTVDSASIAKAGACSYVKNLNLQLNDMVLKIKKCATDFESQKNSINCDENVLKKKKEDCELKLSSLNSIACKDLETPSGESTCQKIKKIMDRDVVVANGLIDISNQKIKDCKNTNGKFGKVKSEINEMQGLISAMSNNALLFDEQYETDCLPKINVSNFNINSFKGIKDFDTTNTPYYCVSENFSGYCENAARLSMLVKKFNEYNKNMCEMDHVVNDSEEQFSSSSNICESGCDALTGKQFSSNSGFPNICREFFPNFPIISTETDVNLDNFINYMRGNRIICEQDQLTLTSCMGDKPADHCEYTINTKDGSRKYRTGYPVCVIRKKKIPKFISNYIPICEGMFRFYQWNLRKGKNLAENYNKTDGQSAEIKYDKDGAAIPGSIECKRTIYSVDIIACQAAKTAFSAYSLTKLAHTVKENKELQTIANRHMEEVKKIVDKSQTGDLQLEGFKGNIEAQNRIVVLAEIEQRELEVSMASFGAALLIWPGKYRALQRCKDEYDTTDSSISLTYFPKDTSGEKGCGAAIENSSTLPLILPNNAIRDLILKKLLELWALYNTVKQKQTLARQASLDLEAQKQKYIESLWTPTPGPADPTATPDVAQINCTNNPYMIGCSNASGGYQPPPTTLGGSNTVTDPSENGDNNPAAPGGGVSGNNPDLPKKEVTWEDKAAPGGGGGGGGAGSQGGPGSSAGGSPGGGGTAPGAAPTQANANVADKSGGGGSVLERSANYGGRGGRSSFSSGAGFGSNGLGRRGDDSKNPFDKMFGDKDGANSRGGIFGAGGDGEGTDRSIAEASDDDNLGYSNLFERISKTANAYFQKGRVGKSAPGSGKGSGSANNKNPKGT